MKHTTTTATSAKASRAKPAGTDKLLHQSLEALTDCAKDYGAILVDPFIPSSTACIPTSPCLKSRKMTTFIRGTMAVGTAGFGFVEVDPRLMWSGYSGSTPLFYSGSTFTGVTMAYTGTGINTANANGDYVAAGDNDVQTRLVAAGLRVAYSGPINTVGGTIAALQEPDHALLNGFSFANVSAYEEADYEVVFPGTWYGCTYLPSHPGDYDWTEANGSAAMNPFMAVTINSTAGNQFAFEAYAHFEVIGVNARGKTMSHADPTGVAAVSTIAISPGTSTTFVSREPSDDKARVIGMLTKMGQYALRGISGAAKLLTAVGPPALKLVGMGVGLASDFAYRATAPSISKAPLKLPGGQRQLLLGYK